MSTENIKKFLQKAYSDEKLAALLAHAQDGKLAYMSCCCLIGIPSAPHALVGQDSCEGNHLWKAREESELAYWAEVEFASIGDNDAERRENLIPLVLEEMQRREAGTTLTNLELAVRYAEMNSGIERSSDSETSDEMDAAVSQGFRP